MSLSLAALPAVGQESPEPPAAPAAGAGGEPSAPQTNPRFDIFEFVVEGNTLLQPIPIEKAVYPQLGEGRTIDDVEKARQALEKAYHDAGYLTVQVDIPEQKVDAGVVVLKVNEAPVERLRVTGARYYSLGEIRAKVPELAPGKVPYFPDVQAQLSQLSREDRRVTPVLKPSRAPGRVDVELKVEDRLPLHGNLALNNRASVDTAELRLEGGLRYENLWQRGHSIGFNFVVAPQDTGDAKVYSLSYFLPAGPGALALYSIASRSDVATLGGIGVIGNGDIYGARYVWPLPSRGVLYHSLSLGADYKDFGEAVRLTGATDLNTPISYTQLTAQYQGSARWSDGAVTDITASVNFAPRDLFGNNDDEFANKRYLASANYVYLRGELKHTENLAHTWQLLLRGGGQWASAPLVNNEQYSLGGQDTVRGYHEAEQLGDSGVSAGIELSTPSVLPGDWGVSLRAVGFVEGGRLRIRDSLPGADGRIVQHITIASAGAGLRLRGGDGFAGALDVAWPLRDTDRTDAGRAKLVFSAGYEF